MFYKYATSTANVSVNTPSLRLNWTNTTVGIGQYIDFLYPYTPDIATAPILVALTHTSRVSTPAVDTIPTGTNGGSSSYFRLIGLARGTDTLVASTTSPVETPATAYTVVDTGRVDPINSWPSTSLKAGDSVAVSFYLHDQAQNIRSTLGAVTFTLTPNANIQFTNGSTVITSITVPAGSNLSPTFYLKGVSPGTGSATFTAPNYKTFVNPVLVVP